MEYGNWINSEANKSDFHKLIMNAMSKKKWSGKITMMCMSVRG